MDTRLLDILVCPLCKGPLVYDKQAFPIRDGIPIMWAEEARDMHAAQPASGASDMPYAD